MSTVTRGTHLWHPITWAVKLGVGYPRIHDCYVTLPLQFAATDDRIITVVAAPGEGSLTPLCHTHPTVPDRIIDCSARRGSVVIYLGIEIGDQNGDYDNPGVC